MTPQERKVMEQEPAAFNGWYCSRCQCGVDASEVTYHEQHTVCGRVITDDVPPPTPKRKPLTDEQKDAVLADVVQMLEKQHDWLTRIAAINLVAGLYGRADRVLAAHGIKE